MGVERLPSGKFKTNATVLQAAMLAFNTLRRIGQGLLTLAEIVPEQVKVRAAEVAKRVAGQHVSGV